MAETSLRSMSMWSMCDTAATLGIESASSRSPEGRAGSSCSAILGLKTQNHTLPPALPNCPLKYPKYHLIETIRPLIEVHWGV